MSTREDVIIALVRRMQAALEPVASQVSGDEIIRAEVHLAKIALTVAKAMGAPNHRIREIGEDFWKLVTELTADGPQETKH